MAGEKKSSKKIEAQAFDVPGSNTSEKDKQSTKNAHASTINYDNQYRTRWWHSQFNLMLAVFSLLVVAAFIFVSLTPDPLENRIVTLVSDDGGISKSETAAKPLETESAPWDEKRRAQARKDSQDILARLLKTKKLLEAQGVSQWANEEFLDGRHAHGYLLHKGKQYH